ncbi:MAG: nucleotidyltransferase [Leptospiraceae bacterium]|nr:MAG: nucleotidyltransferase [Leptospiraceae bacterium]
MNEDNRWIQRLENLKNAFNQLKTAIEIYSERELNDLEKQGMIKAFEYTFELSWNTIRDFFIYQGIYDIKGSRDAIKFAFKYGLIENPDIWIEMIQSRNLTSHTYNIITAGEVIKQIIEKYYKEFNDIINKLETIKKNEI